MSWHFFFLSQFILTNNNPWASKYSEPHIASVLFSIILKRNEACERDEKKKKGWHGSGGVYPVRFNAISLVCPLHPRYKLRVRVHNPPPQLSSLLITLFQATLYAQRPKSHLPFQTTPPSAVYFFLSVAIRPLIIYIFLTTRWRRWCLLHAVGVYILLRQKCHLEGPISDSMSVISLRFLLLSRATATFRIQT